MRGRGGRAALFFKTNSITDKDVIEKLVEASQAGVPVTLFVRGICCIVPGVRGLTEGVRVVSIVGRLLEHSRIYGFGPREDMKVYLSSADLMTRNMDKRIEIAWPVLTTTARADPRLPGRLPEPTRPSCASFCPTEATRPWARAPSVTPTGASRCSSRRTI